MKRIWRLSLAADRIVRPWLCQHSDGFYSHGKSGVVGLRSCWDEHFTWEICCRLLAEKSEPFVERWCWVQATQTRNSQLLQTQYPVSYEADRISQYSSLTTLRCHLFIESFDMCDLRSDPLVECQTPTSNVISGFKWPDCLDLLHSKHANERKKETKQKRKWEKRREELKAEKKNDVPVISGRGRKFRKKKYRAYRNEVLVVWCDASLWRTPQGFWLIAQPTQLTNWLTDWLTDWLTEWLTNQLSDKPTN